MSRKDPLRHPERLIRRVYAYVAYRIGDGPDAEDVTSDVFERAVRYRSSYDPSRAEPVTWLLGIARRCVADHLASRRPTAAGDAPEGIQGPPEDAALDRLVLAGALARIGGRDRELLALRYGADLTARRMSALLGMSENAVEVALHRALARLRGELEGEGAEGPELERRTASA